MRLIDETGKQLGIVSRAQALQTAYERNLDLIQITEKVEPPVCKIVDYGKYLYSKKKKEAKFKIKKTGGIKGIRLRFNISQHDLETRAHQAEKFLKKGNNIKIEMQLRGRERALQNFAKEKLNQFLEILKKSVPIKIDRELKREARGFTIIIAKSTAKNNENKKINLKTF